MSKDDIKLTREELYAKVWSKPATELAKEFGISDVAIGKICRRMNVPKPGPGYWRGLEVGERPQLTPLPKQEERMPSLVFIEPHQNPSTFKSMDQEVSDRIQAESDPANRITVADSLRKAHPLVKAAQLELERRNKSASEGIWLPQEPCLDIRVSRKGMRRALLIMDALLKSLEARGYSIDLGTRERPSTSVVVGRDKVDVHFSRDVRPKPDE